MVYLSVSHFVASSLRFFRVFKYKTTLETSVNAFPQMLTYLRYILNIKFISLEFLAYKITFIETNILQVDCDKSIMVTLKHDDKLTDGTECSFQCALLYTTVYGQRRIRVSTLSLPCTSMLSNLFRSADLDTQFSCFLKQGIWICLILDVTFALLNTIKIYSFFVCCSG